MGYLMESTTQHAPHALAHDELCPHGEAIDPSASSGWTDSQAMGPDACEAETETHNILLTAWERGIGMQWSTSGLINDPESFELLQISPVEEEIIGFLYTGYPAEVPERKRVPASDRTVWFD